MSKIGNWVVEMQEDATWSSRDVFIRRHGLSNVSVWDEVHRQIDEDAVEHQDPNYQEQELEYD